MVKNFLNCKCKCGLEKEVYLYNLCNNKSTRCKSCASKQIDLSKKFTESWKGRVIKGLNRTMYGHIKSKARERNLEFEISQEFLANLLEQQDYKCALTNLDISLSLKIVNGNPNFKYITASLDRIDSSLGYTEENVQWVHKDVNKMKMQYPNDYFIEICKLVAIKHGNTELS